MVKHLILRVKNVSRETIYIIIKECKMGMLGYRGIYPIPCLSCGKVDEWDCGDKSTRCTCGFEVGDEQLEYYVDMLVWVCYESGITEEVQYVRDEKEAIWRFM